MKVFKAHLLRPFANRQRCAAAVAGLMLTISGLFLPASQGFAQDQVTNLWRWDGDGHCETSPAIGPDGTVYLGSLQGVLSAVDSNGQLKWQFRTGLEIRSSAAVAADGTVYFGSRDRRLYALQADGAKKWEFKTGWWVDASPAIGNDGTIYIGSWDRNLYALAPDGSKRWEFATGGPVVSSAAVGANGVVYFGSHDGNFYALTPDGRESWRFKTAGAILSSPALDWDGGSYFTSVDGHCYALDRDGRLRWEVRTGSIIEASPVIGLDGMLLVPANEYVWSITASGEAKRNSCGQETLVSSPVISAAGEVLITFRNGAMFAYGHEWGNRWFHPLESTGSGSPALNGEGRIYVAALGNNLWAIQGGAALARTSWPKFRGNVRNTGNLADNPR